MLRLLPFLLVLTACATTRPIPPDWVVPDGNGDSGAMTRPSVGPVRLEGGRLYRDDKPITEQFSAIESFDYSASRDEVIFSAKKGDNFDIGLAAGDGSVTNWLPADPADELGVQWAPRGNKVSYVVRTKMGDLVRTLHIPTSFHFVVDFGTAATIRSLEWDAAAERFTVVYSTLDASERTESLHYNGSARRMERPPEKKIAADVVPFGPDAFALRPPDLRYGEKLPVVIWVADRFTWSDARAKLMAAARVGCVVVARLPDAAFWTSVQDAPWLDSSQIFVVGAKGPGALSFVADPAIPTGRYRRDGNVVAAAPAAIQSVAAGFIARELKRTSHTNGSSR